MAAAVTPPDSRRTWDGHVDSVRDLSRALAGLQPTDADGRPLAMATVLNLVVAADPAGAADAERVIESLADHQPSRAIIVERDPAGDGIDAHIEAQAQLVGSGRTPSRVELLRLRLHGAAAAGAASAVQALLRPDLPVFLWWPNAPDPTDTVFTELSGRSDRLIAEAGALDGAAAVNALAGAIADSGAAVTDLAWAALTPWRQLLNQLIDGERLAKLRTDARVTIRHVGPEPCLGSLLLAGWLVDSIGPDVAIGFDTVGHGGEPGICEVRIDDGSGQSYEIDRVVGRAAASVVMRSPGAPTHDRMMPMPERTRAQLLAGELELQRHDRPFERAIRHARRLARG